jgi:hypothetical protein
MFVQVIQGKVSDADAVRKHLETWKAEVSPGATGWLGSTGGVTADGRLVALVRFDSAEAAAANSARPEQGAWWQGMAGLFDGEPEFHDSTSVTLDTPGDPSQAGFVQVMQGRTTDPERAAELMTTGDVDTSSYRPEILGSVSAGHDGDQWTMAIYFTSEAEARAGEQKPMPPEMEQMMKEMDAISAGEPTYFDLTDPWMDAPG